MKKLKSFLKRVDFLSNLWYNIDVKEKKKKERAYINIGCMLGWKTMAKITENMKVVLGVLATFEKGAFAREVLEKVEGKTFNGVNATLAAAAGKGYAVKE